MNALVLIETLCSGLLQASNDKFKSTNQAPSLVVYMPRTTLEELVENINRNGWCTEGHIRLNRCKEIITDQTILGYPIIVTEPVIGKVIHFTIAEVLLEG